MNPSLSVTPQNQYDWDSALTQSDDNPFPLAPKNLVARGRITQTHYRLQNELLGHFVEGVMLNEHQLLRGKAVEVLGAGLLRDLPWVVDAIVRFECSVAIRDKSRVACNNAVRFFRQY